MRRVLATVALLTCMIQAAAAQQITKGEVIKLVKAGVSDDVIIAKINQDKPLFSLSAGDIADLKQQGVSERVIQRMLEGKADPAPAPAPAAPASPAPKPTPAPSTEGTGVSLKNDSHVDLFYTLDEKEKIFNVSRSEGTKLEVGRSVSWTLAEGDWRIAIEGGVTIDAFNVAPEQATVLEFRGADTEYIDLVTLVCEDRNGRLVSIISSIGRLTEGQRRRDPSIRPPGQYEGMYGPRFIYLPLISNNVLLGAGVGAIIGHQSGHRTQGALIGAAAGLMLDSMNWRVRIW